jgi:hypothetical protein
LERRTAQGGRGPDAQVLGGAEGWQEEIDVVSSRSIALLQSFGKERNQIDRTPRRHTSRFVLGPFTMKVSALAPALPGARPPFAIKLAPGVGDGRVMP